VDATQSARPDAWGKRDDLRKGHQVFRREGVNAIAIFRVAVRSTRWVRGVEALHLSSQPDALDLGRAVLLLELCMLILQVLVFLLGFLKLLLHTPIDEGLVVGQAGALTVAQRRVNEVGGPALFIGRLDDAAGQRFNLLVK
jgi:hypothetical protein